MKIPILSVTAYNGNPHIRYCTGQENLQAKSGPEPPPARKIHNSNPAPQPRRPGKPTIQIR